MCMRVCSWTMYPGHHSIASLWAFQSCLNCFFLHLHGGAQDFVEILMVLWPRFEACACRCVSVWDVSVLLLPVGGTWWCGGWVLSGSVELARISDSLCETASHLLKEIMKSQKATLPINVHVSALLNSTAFAVCDYLPPLPPSFIHLWREKKSPLGFSSVKSCFLWIIKRLRSQTHTNLKKKKWGIIPGNHVMDYLLHWQDGWGENNYGFSISLCQLAVVLQPLCFAARVVKTPL